jgi:hypothetical protein
MDIRCARPHPPYLVVPRFFEGPACQHPRQRFCVAVFRAFRRGGVLCSSSATSAMRSADMAGQSVVEAVATAAAAQLTSEARGIDDWC